jgi:signal transduction histidine kinase/HPt (histidine-containing phosphotransfer) domain-containing protein
MSEASLSALLIEDNAADADLLVEMLAGEEEFLRVDRVECMAQAESFLKDASDVDVILLDLGLPDSEGLDSLAKAGRAAPHVPIVVLTGLDDEELGVEAVRKGAQDYLVKGQATPRLLARVIRHAVERNRLIEAKNQFLANISHELRTPMNAILGMIDLALRNELKPSVKDYLSTARESAGLLLGLLNNLLDSAKIESGSFELEIAPLDIRQVLDQTASALAVRAAEKGLAFSCQAPTDLPAAVLGDKLRLRQVLLNLGGNAIKFTERGEVAMSVRTLEMPNVESQMTNEFDIRHSSFGEVCLEFAVRDTGVGIPRGDLDRIFKPFAQGDASTARRYGGTGLGLSISADLVAMMGGRLWAESEPGQGSTFYFSVYLPLARQLPSLHDASARARPTLPASMRILLVEDNPASQKLVAYIFQEAGHSIDIAEDGQQALHILEKTSYDAVFMDVQMPVMDGLAATAAIRVREGRAPLGTSGRRRVPIIAMTARAMKGDRERCLAAGMDGYVSKPIDAAQLFDELARLTTGGATLDPSEGCATADPPADRGEGADVAPAGVFDLPTALERCCQSWEVFGDMVACLCADNEQQFPQMYAALDRGDFEELGRLAHRMRGTLSCLAGKSVLDAAAAVEQITGGWQTQAREAIVKLEELVAALITQCQCERKGPAVERT